MHIRKMLLAVTAVGASAVGAAPAQAQTFAYGNGGYTGSGGANSGNAVTVQVYGVHVNNRIVVHCDAQSNGAIYIELDCGELRGANAGPATTVNYVAAGNDPRVCWSVRALFPFPSNDYTGGAGCTTIVA